MRYPVFQVLVPVKAKIASWLTQRGKTLALGELRVLLRDATLMIYSLHKYQASILHHARRL